MEEFDSEIERKLQGTDIVKAVHKAKLRSTRLLEEQGISTLALILSKTLIDVIEHPEKMEMVDQDENLFSKQFVMEILSIEGVELLELLSRESRLMHQSRFKMRDRTDIPHVISAFVENCNYIITYDSHFDNISHLVRVSTPEELISELTRTEK